MREKTRNSKPKRARKQLLRRMAVVDVDAAGVFVVREHLAELNIRLTNPDFDRLFSNKVETNVPSGRIAVHLLNEDSLDPEIISKLGKIKRIIPFAHFIQVLKKYNKGLIKGASLKKDLWILAYCLGNDGYIWAVCADRYSVYRDWLLVADPVSRPRPWGAGRQVLSQA